MQKTCNSSKKMGSTKKLLPKTKGWEASGTRVEHQTWYSAPFRMYEYYKWTQNFAITIQEQGENLILQEHKKRDEPSWILDHHDVRGLMVLRVSLEANFSEFTTRLDLLGFWVGGALVLVEKSTSISSSSSSSTTASITAAAFCLSSCGGTWTLLVVPPLPFSRVFKNSWFFSSSRKNLGLDATGFSAIDPTKSPPTHPPTHPPSPPFFSLPSQQ